MKKNGSTSSKPVIITIIAVVVLGILMLITSGERTTSWIESVINAIFTPVQTFAQTVSNGIVKGVQNLFNTTDADKENEQLKTRIAELEVTAESYEELRLENERLKALLNYAQTLGNAKYVTASVIETSNTKWFDIFTVNAGKNSGITEGDPVITGDGLVGTVFQVSATSCKVRSLIDANEKIGILIERTRDIGFVRGTIKAGSGNDTLELYFLQSGRDLTPGDVIVTNGLGSEQIPKGIKIGTVSEVMRVSGTGTNEANAIITPSVDFAHMEDVMIITDTGDIAR